MILKSITAKGNQVAELGRVNVLVGPNNSGKSECLRDIHRLMSDREPDDTDRDVSTRRATVVLSEIRYVSSRSPEQMLQGLQVLTGESDGATTVQGLNSNLQAAFRTIVRKDAWRVLARPDLTSEAIRQGDLIHLMPLRVAFGPLATRLQAGNSSPASSPIAAPANLLQLLHLAPPAIHEALCSTCHETFGVDVRLDASERIQLTLRVGDSIPAEPHNPLEAVAMYARFRRLEEEGDGLRNFVGTLLSILLLPGRVVLLDQPEAYLHPTQCTGLGTWIGSHSATLQNQLIIATHSTAFLEGLTSVDGDVGVIRFTRQDGETRLVSLPQPVLKALARAPQLSGQHAMESVFREGVVITSTDTDRVVFAAVASGPLGDTRTSFLQCRGRANVSELIKLFRNANLPVCAALDMRVFDSATDFAELVEVVTGAPPSRGWMRIRQKLADVVEGRLDERKMAQSTRAIEIFLDQLKSGSPESAQFERTNKAMLTEHWVKFNQEGPAALPKEMRLWVQELIDELKRCGVFVCSKGNTENWFDLDAAREHSEDWFIAAMLQLTQGHCPIELKVFVSEMLYFVQSSGVLSRPARLRNQA